MTQIGNLIVSWGLLFLIAVAVMVLWNLAAVLWALTSKAYMKSVDYLTIAIVRGGLSLFHQSLPNNTSARVSWNCVKDVPRTFPNDEPFFIICANSGA